MRHHRRCAPDQPSLRFSYPGRNSRATCRHMDARSSAANGKSAIYGRTQSVMEMMDQKKSSKQKRLRWPLAALAAFALGWPALAAEPKPDFEIKTKSIETSVTLD